MARHVDSHPLLLAALAGLFLGAACKGAAPAPSGETKTKQATAPLGSAAPSQKDKACCKGRNDCKGKGGCAVAGKHDCSGKNDCKGQGGCDMNC
jgi:hypothetical protein